MKKLKKPTLNQKLKVARMRARLGRQVNDFINSASTFLPNLEESDLKPTEDEEIAQPEDQYYVEPEEPEEIADGSLDDEEGLEEEDEDQAASLLPEAIVLPLPSNITSKKIKSSLESLLSIERQLRKGQANDALEGVRIGLANKSLLLLTDVNQSRSTKQSTRAWTSVRNAQSQILLHANSYHRAWQALNSIGTSEDLEVYQRLDQKHLVVVKDITMEKQYGQGSDGLAWFWRIGPNEDSLTGEWMEECEQFILLYSLSI